MISTSLGPAPTIANSQISTCNSSGRSGNFVKSTLVLPSDSGSVLCSDLSLRKMSFLTLGFKEMYSLTPGLEDMPFLVISAQDGR